MSDKHRMSTVEVQLISAPWCRRCGRVKPEVEQYCKLTGTTLTLINFDDLEEEEKATITSLPTIRMRRVGHPEWSIYFTDTLETWKTDIVKLVPPDTDF